ncbi:hypothetical protein FRC02_004280 [Tulasnella sp. 418]|nr:hypothetical protein FRC02_004280 [Tulasnella sp. 418]
MGKHHKKHGSKKKKHEEESSSSESVALELVATSDEESGSEALQSAAKWLKRHPEIKPALFEAVEETNAGYRKSGSTSKNEKHGESKGKHKQKQKDKGKGKGKQGNSSKGIKKEKVDTDEAQPSYSKKDIKSIRGLIMFPEGKEAFEQDTPPWTAKQLKATATALRAQREKFGKYADKEGELQFNTAYSISELWAWLLRELPQDITKHLPLPDFNDVENPIPIVLLRRRNSRIEIISSTDMNAAVVWNEIVGTAKPAWGDIILCFTPIDPIDMTSNVVEQNSEIHGIKRPRAPTESPTVSPSRPRARRARQGLYSAF